MLIEVIKDFNYSIIVNETTFNFGRFYRNIPISFENIISESFVTV